MPYFHFKEVWTPLKLVRIRFYRDEERRLWIKAGSGRRRPVRQPLNGLQQKDRPGSAPTAPDIIVITKSL